MRTATSVQNVRRVLCVFPAYEPSFGTFSHAYALVGAKAFMPPQGLLLIAGYLPAAWEVRFSDENVAPLTAADLAWCDVVLISGMHIQKTRIHDINRRAHAAGKMTVLGGPSVSAAPDDYPDVDCLHIGELGDATDRLIELLDRQPTRPDRPLRFTTSRRLALAEFPLPAYDLVDLGAYLLGTLQFSSGCPYQCEFCDIPALYGRVPRLKSLPQLIGELDFLLSQDAYPASLYFVDDNFIGNRKAAREMLPHLVDWQKRNGYPVTFACEATLNIAKQPEILALMREARFDAVFIGIETPELGALKAMRKDHNAALPLLDAIRTLNGYGLEVVSGIILGLDTDTPETEAALKDFVDGSQIPMLTMNLLQALPRTALWERLARAGRLIDDASRESNVRFVRGYDEVVSSWRRCIDHAYDPERLYARFTHQIQATYANRLAVPAKGRLTASNIKRGATLLINLLLRIGILADYRRPFWRMAWAALKGGQIEALFGVGFISYHLIEFSREAARGEQNASFYSARIRRPAVGMARTPHHG